MSDQTFPEYEPHQEVRLLPPMTSAEQAALKESLRTQGLLDPIVLYQGRIAEGHHRYQVARQLIDEGVPTTQLRMQFRELAAAELAGGPLRDWVLARNCLRRHLSASQVAIVAAREYCETLGQESSQRPASGKQRPQCAARFGISERLLQDAVTIYRSQRSELREAIFSGELAVHAALAVLRGANQPRRAPSAALPAATESSSSNSPGAGQHTAGPDLPRRVADLVEQLELLRHQARSFGTIYADPAWALERNTNQFVTHPQQHWLSVAELCRLPVAELAAPQSHLHLWTTNELLWESRTVLEAWGFAYRSLCVWVAPQSQPGIYWRQSHALCLLGVRGDCPFASEELMSWFEVDRPVTGEKPAEMRTRIQEVSPGPYLELFGGRQAAGWTVFGDAVSTAPEEMESFSSQWRAPGSL